MRPKHRICVWCGNEFVVAAFGPVSDHCRQAECVKRSNHDRIYRVMPFENDIDNDTDSVVRRVRRDECRVSGCHRRVALRGMCTGHYSQYDRMLRQKTPMPKSFEVGCG